jgi:site-specific DNA-adenine methylase
MLSTHKDGSRGVSLSAVMRVMKRIGNAAWNYLGGKRAIVTQRGYDGIIEPGERVTRVVDAFGGSGLPSQLVKHAIPDAGRTVNDLNPEISNLHTQVRDNPQAVIDAGHRVFDDFTREVLSPGYETEAQAIAGLTFADTFAGRPTGSEAERAALLSLRFSSLTGGALGKGDATAEDIPGGIKWAELAARPTLDQAKVDKLKREFEANIRGHSKDLQGAEVTTKDARAVLAEAKPGEVVFADSPYYSKDEGGDVLKYGEEYGADLTTIEGSLSFIRDSVFPAAQRGVKVVYSNYWNDAVAQVFTDAGFRARKVERQGQHGKKVYEIIAWNPRDAAITAEPARAAPGADTPAPGRAEPLARGPEPAGTVVPPAGPKPAPAGAAPVSGPRVRTSDPAALGRVRGTLESAFSGFAAGKLDLDGPGGPALVFHGGERLPLIFTKDPLDPTAWLTSQFGVRTPAQFVDLAKATGLPIPREWKHDGGQPPSVQRIMDGWAALGLDAKRKMMERSTPGLSIQFGDAAPGSPFAFILARESLLGRAGSEKARVGSEEGIHALWRGVMSDAERALVLAYAAKAGRYAGKARAAEGDAGRAMELGTQVLLDLGDVRAREVQRGADRDAALAYRAATSGPIARVLDRLVKVAGDLWARMARSVGVKPDLGLQSRLAPELFQALEGIRTGEIGARPFRRGGTAEEAAAVDRPGTPREGDEALAVDPPDEQAPVAREGIAWRGAMRQYRDDVGKDAPVTDAEARERADEILNSPDELDRVVRAFQRGNVPLNGRELMGSVVAVEEGQRQLGLRARAEGSPELALRAVKLMEIEQRLGTAAGRILHALRGDQLTTVDGVESLFSGRLQTIGSTAWKKKLAAARKASGEAGEAKVAKAWLAAQNAVVKTIKDKTGFDLNDRKTYERMAEAAGEGDFYAVNMLHDAVENLTPMTRRERLDAWQRRATLGALTAEIVRGNILSIGSFMPQAATMGMLGAEASLKPLVAKLLGQIRRDLPADVTEAFGGTGEVLRSFAENIVDSARLAIDSSRHGEARGYKELAGRFSQKDKGDSETQASEGGRALIPGGLRHLLGPGAEMVRMADEFVWGQVFRAKQAHLAARAVKSGLHGSVAEAKGDVKITDAAVKEADTWTLRGEYEGRFESWLGSVGKLRHVQDVKDGEMRTNYLGLAVFGMLPIFKSFVKGMSMGLGLANIPGNLAKVGRAAIKRSDASAEKIAGAREITVEELAAQDFNAGVEGGARLLLGAALLTAGALLGGSEPTDDSGSLARNEEKIVRSTATTPGTLDNVPTTRLSPWFEATQIGAIAKAGWDKGGTAGRESVISSLIETLLNRPLLSGLPVPRTDPATGARWGTGDRLLKQSLDLLAVGRPYVDAYRKATETTARTASQSIDDWVTRNYDLTRAERSSWLGEKRPTGGFMRKMLFGGASVPTKREQDIAEHIVRVNAQMKGENKPYWFPPAERVFHGKRGWRYTDVEYEQLRAITGASFVDYYGKLPATKDPVERLYRMREAWLLSRAKAESIVQPGAVKRLTALEGTDISTR